MIYYFVRYKLIKRKRGFVLRMEKKKIGIDLDDVVFEFVKFLIAKYKNKFGKKILFEDFVSYHFAEVWHLNLSETIDFFKKIMTKESTENLELCEFAKESIFDLSSKYEIYFITSRIFPEGTLESLNKHFSDISFELIFSSNPYAKTNGKTKGQICKELEIDFMIEDSKEHSEICASDGIKTFLLDKPWNKDVEENENIIRVKNWKEILEKLK